MSLQTRRCKRSLSPIAFSLIAHLSKLASDVLPGVSISVDTVNIDPARNLLCARRSMATRVSG